MQLAIVQLPSGDGPMVEAGADGRMAALGHVEQNDSRWLLFEDFSCLDGGRVPGLSHCW